MTKNLKQGLTQFFESRRGLRSPLTEDSLQPTRVPAPGATSAMHPDSKEAVHNELWDEHGDDLTNLAYMHSFKGHRDHLPFHQVVAHRLISHLADGQTGDSHNMATAGRIGKMTVSDLLDHAHDLGQRAYYNMNETMNNSRMKPADVEARFMGNR